MDEHLNIGHVPAIIWGDVSSRVYVYVHGQEGCKEEAEAFASIADRYGFQVLSIDLPGHGERRGKTSSLSPWVAVSDLQDVMPWARSRWESVSLFSVSIGVWLSMLAFQNERLERCLFVSPIIDMGLLIQKMISQAGVSLERLRREKLIKTAFRQMLSWEYFDYAVKNRVDRWMAATSILYPGKDHLEDRSVVEAFSCDFNGELTVWDEGEHWFHTASQLDFLYRWFEDNIVPSASQV
nr:alpha/beta hydrolase [Lautropia mirabilis]